jgi:hypothetical protein
LADEAGDPSNAGSDSKDFHFGMSLESVRPL